MCVLHSLPVAGRMKHCTICTVSVTYWLVTVTQHISAAAEHSSVWTVMNVTWRRRPGARYVITYILTYLLKGSL